MDSAINAAGERVAIGLTVNGQEVEGAVEPRLLLADFLRDDLDLPGTHVGCEHGVCGACTVLVDGAPVRACLTLAVQVDGCAVRTVEGLASGGELHPLQEAFRRRHALQCGFCTPGFLMTAVHMIEQGEVPDDESELRAALAGNLCRCTGYQNIVDAVRDAADRMRANQEEE